MGTDLEPHTLGSSASSRRLRQFIHFGEWKDYHTRLSASVSFPLAGELAKSRLIISAQNPRKQKIQSPPLLETASNSGSPPVPRPYSHDLRLLGHICRECLCSSVIRVKGAKWLLKKRTRREVMISRVENAPLVGIQLIKLFKLEKCGYPRITAVLAGWFLRPVQRDEDSQQERPHL